MARSKKEPEKKEKDRTIEAIGRRQGIILPKSSWLKSPPVQTKIIDDSLPDYFDENIPQHYYIMARSVLMGKNNFDVIKSGGYNPTTMGSANAIFARMKNTDLFQRALLRAREDMKLNIERKEVRFNSTDFV